MLLLLVTMASMAQQQKEDANGDRQVNLSDVTTVINHILSPGAPAIANKTFKVNGVSFDMIAVEGGSFSMGATSEQVGDANNNEYPAHPVTLSSFYIGKTEVTQALWEAVMGINPSYHKGEKLPVVGRLPNLYLQIESAHRPNIQPSHRSTMGICSAWRKSKPRLQVQREQHPLRRGLVLG